MNRRSLLPAAVLMAGAACSPALDWREVRPESTGLTVLLPCKPASHARQVALAGAPGRMTLAACAAGGATWAIAYAELSDPARTAAALIELRAAAAGNLRAGAPRPLPLAIKGATPNAESGRWALAGHYPDGRAAQMELAVFARGTLVFQASVLGERIDAGAAETFLTSAHFRP